MRIATQKILKFRSVNNSLWHEGLSEEEAKILKKNVTGKFGILWKKFYWPKGKSYIFQSRLMGNVYCITKKYYDSL